MNTLDRKLFRDLLRWRGQLIAIALVVACEIASFVTMVNTSLDTVNGRLLHFVGRTGDSHPHGASYWGYDWLSSFRIDESDHESEVVSVALDCDERELCDRVSDGGDRCFCVWCYGAVATGAPGSDWGVKPRPHRNLEFFRAGFKGSKSLF